MARSCAVAKDIGRTLLDVAGIAAAFCKVKLTVGVRPTDSQFVRWSRYLNLDLAIYIVEFLVASQFPACWRSWKARKALGKCGRTLVALRGKALQKKNGSNGDKKP